MPANPPRRRRIVILLMILLAEGVVVQGCVTMPSSGQLRTKSPRDGRLLTPVGLPGQMAIVYTVKSEVNLAGLESLHPGDIHRQGSIFKALVASGLIQPDQVFVPDAATDEQLLAVHDADYLASLRYGKTVGRVLETPIVSMLPDAAARSGVVTPFRYAAGGTLKAADLAVEHGLAFNLGGGFHHAFRDHGEGFCLFADVPLAIHHLRAAGKARKAMIVDCDIHQGNGNASFFIDDRDVAIFDIYERDNYPSVKQPESHGHPIPFGISQADYLAILTAGLPPLLDTFKPDVLFYIAGVDPMEGDTLGHAHVSASGLVERDMFVIRQARQREIPTVVVLGGGYGRTGWRVTCRTIAALLTGRDREPAGK